MTLARCRADLRGIPQLGVPDRSPKEANSHAPDLSRRGQAPADETQTGLAPRLRSAASRVARSDSRRNPDACQRTNARCIPGISRASRASAVGLSSLRTFDLPSIVFDVAQQAAPRPRENPLPQRQSRPTLLRSARCHRANHVPSPGFRTLSTAFSSPSVRACCIPLPIMGFTPFAGSLDLSTEVVRPAGTVLGMRFTPLEGFHSSAAAPRLRGRCPLAVYATGAVPPTPSVPCGTRSRVSPRRPPVARLPTWSLSTARSTSRRCSACPTPRCREAGLLTPRRS